VARHRIAWLKTFGEEIPARSSFGSNEYAAIDKRPANTFANLTALKTEPSMPTYIMRQSPDGRRRKTLQETPERLGEVNKKSKMGARILRSTPPRRLRFVNVIEAPNNDAMMRISMELGSRGTIRIETMAALNLAVLSLLQNKAQAGNGFTT
jgi:uncharacterized protein with GYD domain